jgi:hypothetical protein
MRSRKSVIAIVYWRVIRAISFMVVMTTLSPAWALITGGEGNDPISNSGWPEGAAAVFNSKSRVAYWEGPPLGGGQSHSECRGETKDLQEVLDHFAKMEIPKKRVILHDGVGSSFWLNANREKEKKDAAKIDWVFVVWNTKQLANNLSHPFLARRMTNGDDLMIARLDVYTGGSIRWKDITVPEEVEIIDKRLEAHGFQTSDGTVLEGRVTDVSSEMGLTARLVLERIESQAKQGYAYTPVSEIKSSADGHWVLKNSPQGWFRLISTADGYASRIVGHVTIDDQPTWSEWNTALAKAGRVSGKVVGKDGKPLADVSVRLDDLDVGKTNNYDVPIETPVKTDRDGRFVFEQTPIGSGKIWVNKPGYVRPGLGSKVEIPATDVTIVMLQAASLHVRVDFTDTQRPGDYMIHCEPEEGEEVGKWSGDASISAENDFKFENIPPGRYVVKGRPNPGAASQETKPVVVDLKGGQTTELTVKAK